MARPAANARRDGGGVGSRAAGPRGRRCPARALRGQRRGGRPHARAAELQAAAGAGRLTSTGELPQVEMFTDGACRGNPGPGGWAVLIRAGARERELSGGEPLTTNNRMELKAAIEGLNALKKPYRVELTTECNNVS